MIDKKKVANLNFSNNVDGFLAPNIDDENYKNSNFLHRFSDYLESKHYRTLKHLSSSDQKNLVVAFTHIDEWKNSKVTEQVRNLIQLIKLNTEEELDEWNDLTTLNTSPTHKYHSFKFFQSSLSLKKIDSFVSNDPQEE